MQNRPYRLGPLAITNAAANILNPPALTGGVGVGALNSYILLTHIRAVNKSGSPGPISLFIGATGGSAAGTEFAWSAQAVAANSSLDWNGRLRLDVTDFLTALANANTTITLDAEGEIGLV